MHIQASSQNCDLTQYPQLNELQELTLPSIDANALLFTYLLVKFKVINIDMNSYDWLVSVYQSPQNNLTAQHINSFNKLIENSSVDNHVSLRFLGPLLAGQGPNDYYILKILNHLKNKGVKYEIILSKNDVEFALEFEHQKGITACFEPLTEPKESMPSREALSMFVSKKIVNQNSVDEMVKHAFLPALKALSYSSKDQNGKELIIFSQPKVDFSFLTRIAEEFGLKNDGGSIYELRQPQAIKHCIDSVNNLLNNAIKTQRLCVLFSTAIHHDIYDIKTASCIAPPLVNLLWKNNHAMPSLVTHTEDHQIGYFYAAKEKALSEEKNEFVTNLMSPINSNSSKTLRNVQVAIKVDRVLSYHLNTQQNSDNKLLSIDFNGKIGRFSIKTAHCFEVPNDVDDKEVIRRLHLIYSSNVINTRAMCFQKTFLALPKPLQPTLATFKNTNIEYFIGVDKEKRDYVDIYIEHINDRVQITSRYRYFTGKALTIKEVEHRLEIAFSQTMSPYLECRKLFSPQYQTTQETMPKALFFLSRLHSQPTNNKEVPLSEPKAARVKTTYL